jgi:hemerythrin-like domain-containing protein
MTAPVDLPLADTTDMIGLHRVFREALAAAPALVGGASENDADRVELVASYYANVLDLLHSHHEGEDELLTPRLLARVPTQAATISRVGGQHETVLAAVGAAEAAIANWRVDPSAVHQSDAVTALAALDAGLTPHLDEEERDILPIAAQCINVAEWGELPAHGMRSFRGDKMWLIIGLIQEQMSPSHRADMEAHMPPPMLEFWRSDGRGMFDSYVAELRR